MTTTRALTALAALALLTPARAADFDAPDALPCRDVTTEEWKVKHPNTKVVEAVFRVSLDVSDAEASGNVGALQVRLGLPEGATLLDFLPRRGDAQPAALAGAESEDATEPAVAITCLNGDHYAYRIRTEATTQQRVSEIESAAPSAAAFRRMPIAEAVAGTGTRDRGRAVAIRFAPIPHGATYDLPVLLEVPSDWAGGVGGVTVGRQLEGVAFESLWEGKVAAHPAGDLEGRQRLLGELRAAPKPTPEPAKSK